MKTKLYLSLFCGVLFGLMSYWICNLLFPSLALVIAISAGVLFAVLLFPTLMLEEKRVNKKYSEFEKAIISDVVYKANGNFNLGNKVRNGNIYFCENGIVFASLDQKPFAVEELPLPFIEKYELDNIHVNIHTKDERVFLITTPQADEILNVLKDKKWVV